MCLFEYEKLLLVKLFLTLITGPPRCLVGKVPIILIITVSL